MLLITALTIAWFISISISTYAINFAAHPRGGPGDVELYQAEIHRVAAGQNYYDAANAELRPRGYPTRSVFNWRTPLPIWLIGVLPGTLLGRLFIGVPAALLVALAVHVTGREGNIASGLLCGLLLVGALMPCWLEDTYIMPVIWAGVFIGLSVSAYAIDRTRWGVGFGLAALFFRELAGPYCVVCLAMAIIEKRWKQTAAWLLGLAAYAGFFAWHYWQVMARIRPGDPAHSDGWIQLIGSPFVLAVAQMNSFLLLLPQWVTAVFLPLAMIGFASWNTAAGRRAGITACVFIVMFAFVGHPFNQYWGALIAPLVCLGAAQSTFAIADLSKRARDLQINLPAPPAQCAARVDG